MPVSFTLICQGNLPSNERQMCGGLGLALKIATLVAFCILSVSQAHADGSGIFNRAQHALKPLSIDCKPVGAVVEASSSGPCRIHSGTTLKTGSQKPIIAPLRNRMTGGLTVTSVLEFNTQNRPSITHRQQGVDLAFVDDSTLERDDVYIHRVSTSLSGPEGTLTVGKNWSNFGDFLPSLGGLPVTRGLTTDQLSWATQHELGEITVTLESNYELEGHNHPLDRSPNESTNEGDSSSTSLMVSWRGQAESNQGLYGISAISRELEYQDDRSSDTTSETTGWGMNLFGGWRFGEFFTSLSVTVGNSIDSFILGKEGDRDTARAAIRYLRPGKSININPSINYRLSEDANIHLSVNRFTTDSQDTPHGVESLDTIHLGYSWSPWPSTRLGIEFVEKDVEGTSSMQDSRKVKIQARKEF